MSEHIGHVHGPTSGHKMWLSLIVTSVFVIGEAIAGYMAHSLALLSDAGHNLSDALALGLAAFAIWIAQRPSSAERTFGYHRVSILTALFNAVSLVVLALWIGIEAFHHFRNPDAVSGPLMIWVALIAVVMNTAIAYALMGEAKHSLNSRAAFVHMAGDALSAVAVVIAGVVIHFTGWIYADPLVSVIIAVFILYSAWGIVVEATNILLEGTPKDVDVIEVIASMKSVELVRDVHDMHVWTVGDGLVFLSCHVSLPANCSLEQCATVVTTLNEKLHDEFNIGHATIQTEIEGLCDTGRSATVFCALETHNHEHDHEDEEAHAH